MNDREKLIDLLDEYVDDELYANDTIADQLIANGVVVREKGEWEAVKYTKHCSCGKTYDTYYAKCKVCQRVARPQPYGLNFCPNCGSDMRKGENG